MVPIWDRAVVSHGQRGEVGALCKEEDAPPAVMRFACDQSVSTQDVHQRAKKYGVLRQYVYELWDTAPLAVLCIEFAAGMLAVRSRDLVQHDEDYEDGNDRWNPDVYACWAYAGSTHLYPRARSDEECDISARRDFWNWYVMSAIPLAMGLAPLSERKLPERDGTADEFGT